VVGRGRPAPGVRRRGSTARPGVYCRVRRLTARDVPAPPPLMMGCVKAPSAALHQPVCMGGDACVDSDSFSVSASPPA
jgi:hypothetical protein